MPVGTGRVIARRSRHRSVNLVFFTVATGGILALVIASPLAMRAFGGHRDWTRLSDIGQAYGGISAVLSALALCGIAVSVLLQSRQNRIAELAAARERHFELVKISFDRPELMQIFGTVANPPDRALIVYTNLWLAHWSMLLELGIMSEDGLRQNVAELFASADASVREWWRDVGPRWDTTVSEVGRRFVRIVTQENERCFDATASEQDLTAEDSGLRLSAPVRGAS